MFKSLRLYWKVHDPQELIVLDPTNAVEENEKQVAIRSNFLDMLFHRSFFMSANLKNATRPADMPAYVVALHTTYDESDVIANVTDAVEQEHMLKIYRDLKLHCEKIVDFMYDKPRLVVEVKQLVIDVLKSAYYM